MIHNLLVVTILAVFLSACGGSLPMTETPVVTPTQSMEEPTEGPSSEPLNNEYLPQPEDENFSRGEVFINSTDVLIMESYPIQVALVLKGELPTPCNHLRVVASPPNDQNQIQVAVYSVIDPAETCIQVIEPFEANIMLGSFESGHYTVLVNGEMVSEFDA